MREDHRRYSPRIGVQALCWEMVGGHERSSLIVDLSSDGARLERPYVGGKIQREVALQLEVPGIDEVMWAKGEVCFDHLVQAKGPAGGVMGLVRRTGYRIAVAATRDLKMLRELVFDTDAMHRHLAEEENDDMLVWASCYSRG
jgi:hypothetical protein